MLARTAALALLLAAPLFPQATDPDKPDPRKKAKALLDGAAVAVAGAKPEIQAVGLMHLADNYQALDRKKSLEFFRQAFAAMGALPPEHGGVFREGLQAEVVRRVADLDLGEAITMLRQLPTPSREFDYRWQAIDRVVRSLMDKSQLDQAIELINSIGTGGWYPFLSASQVFGKLSADDPRRTILFGSAMSAYTLKPSTQFHLMLSRYWQEIPRPMAQTALQAILNAILDRKDDGSYEAQSTSTAKGTVTFNTRQDAELFDVMHLVRTIDPKRAGEILEARPELRAALELYPQGRRSMDDGSGRSVGIMASGGGKRPSPELEAKIRLQALTASRVAAAMNAIQEDPDKALELVRAIPSPARQAEVLGAIARSVGEKDPGKAKSVLRQSIAMLDEIKNPGERVATWDAVAEAAHQINDDATVRQALDRTLADAAELLKSDSEAGQPNFVPREYWPSTQAYRRVVARAAKCFGVDAEPILEKIADPDVNLLARIELAQALLGRPLDINQSYAPRVKR